jgi:signal transduction histidine kinase
MIAIVSQAGLGLAITDRVIRMHGGTLHAQNASPRGLRVDIFLLAAK